MNMLVNISDQHSLVGTENTRENIDSRLKIVTVY